MSGLVLYYDENCSQPLIIEMLGKVDAGDEKVINAFLKNEDEFDHEQIYYETPEKELFLTNLPSELGSRRKKEVQIKFKPTITREKALNSFITIHSKKVIPAE